MTPKILVAIQSCHRDRDRQQAQRDTWLSDIKSSDYKFFLGRPKTNLQCIDEVFLDVEDTYLSLPAKTQAMCQWALARNYDYVFKCDTDTFVNVRLASSGEYLGGENADVDVPGFPPGPVSFCSGGAGYWLNKKSLTIVAEAGTMDGVQAEDVFVAHALKQEGILPTFHPGYKWRPGATVDKNTASLHLSSALQKKYEPEQMYEAYRQMRGFYGV